MHQGTHTSYLLAEAIPAIKPKLLAIGQHPRRARYRRGKQSGPEQCISAADSAGTGGDWHTAAGKACSQACLSLRSPADHRSAALHSTALVCTHGPAEHSTAKQTHRLPGWACLRGRLPLPDPAAQPCQSEPAGQAPSAPVRGTASGREAVGGGRAARRAVRRAPIAGMQD
jgi:hypothetical protein